MSTELATKQPLPTIDELRADIDLSLLAKQNDLNVLLNEPPPAHWLKRHPYIKDYEYLPIERVEWLLTRIFVEWYCELLGYQLLANSVACHVRLHYRDPITGGWRWRDGVGASALQTDKGAKPTDLNALKSSAVEMSLPKAKTEAIKDAAGDLGRIFGRDLNRKATIEYRSMLGQINNPISEEELSRLTSLIEATDGLETSQVLALMGVASLEEIPASRFNEALSRITDYRNYNG